MLVSPVHLRFAVETQFCLWWVRENEDYRSALSLEVLRTSGKGKVNAYISKSLFVFKVSARGR